MADERPAPQYRNLKVTISGDGMPKVTTINVHIPPELSRRLAKMYLIETVTKELRRYAADEALKDIGFK